MEYNNLHQFGVVFEMSLDLVEHQRQVYGFLDWLSDCGGLASALTAMIGILGNILMFELLDFYMVEQLYSR